MVTIGQTGDGTNTSIFAANYTMGGNAYTAPASGTITTMSIRANGNQTINFRLGIYRASDRVLIGQTSAVASLTTGWNNLNASGTITLVNGVDYILVFQGSTTVNLHYYVGTDGVYASRAYSSGFENPESWENDGWAYEPCIYATYGTVVTTTSTTSTTTSTTSTSTSSSSSTSTSTSSTSSTSAPLTYFFDGFESGDFSAWDISSGSGQSISGTYSYDGDYSAEIDYAESSTILNFETFTTIYLRMYVLFNAVPAEGNLWSVAWISGYDDTIEVVIEGAEGQCEIGVFYSGDYDSDGPIDISTGEWHELFLFATITDGNIIYYIFWNGLRYLNNSYSATDTYFTEYGIEAGALLF